MESAQNPAPMKLKLIVGGIVGVIVGELVGAVGMVVGLRVE